VQRRASQQRFQARGRRVEGGRCTDRVEHECAVHVQDPGLGLREVIQQQLQLAAPVIVLMPALQIQRSLERSPPTVAAWVALHFLFRGWTEPISRPELHAIQKHCFAALIRLHAARSDCLVRSAHARNFGCMLDDQTNPIRTSFPIVTHDGRRNFTMRPSLLWHNCTLGKAGCTPTTVTATTAPQSQPPNIYNSNKISNGSRQVRTSRYSS
jgi:hypothetical protein